MFENMFRTDLNWLKPTNVLNEKGNLTGATVLEKWVTFKVTVQ